MSTHLFIVDGQNDFVEGGSLAVPGGTAAMQAVGELVRGKGRMFNVIHGSVDQHPRPHIAHPDLWVGADGQPPAPFTVISSDDVKNGVWRPRMATAKPSALGGKTMLDYCVDYIAALEAEGRHHTIWEVHCQIGSLGAAIQPDLFEALSAWEGRYTATIRWIAKGSNPFTEHFGALRAEVPLNSDPTTGLNGPFLRSLQEADRIYFAGLALNFCLRRTMEQTIDNVDPELVRKFVLLTDGAAKIPGIPGDDTEQWLESIQSRGVALATTLDV